MRKACYNKEQHEDTHPSNLISINNELNSLSQRYSTEIHYTLGVAFAMQ